MTELCRSVERERRKKKKIGPEWKSSHFGTSGAVRSPSLDLGFWS